MTASSAPPPPRRPSLGARLFTEPVCAAALESQALGVARPALRWLGVLAPTAAVALLVYLVLSRWTPLPSELAPRHRPEALCFALAQPDPSTHQRFTPPMEIVPSAALVRGRFTSDTPPGVALREVMRLSESMIMREWKQPAGEYEVTVMWLRFPAESGARHWLVLGWMEGADLAVCNFRFAGDSRDLTPEETQWGQRLLERVLTPANFQASGLPPLHLRVPGGNTMPTFGPQTAR